MDRPWVEVGAEQVREGVAGTGEYVGHTRFANLVWQRVSEDGLYVVRTGPEPRMEWEARSASFQEPDGVPVPNPAPYLLELGSLDLSAVTSLTLGSVLDERAWDVTGLGHVVHGRPATAVGADGLVSVYACEEDGLLHLHRQGPAPGRWAGRVALGWPADGGLVALSRPGADAVVVCANREGTLWATVALPDGRFDEEAVPEIAANAAPDALPAVAVHAGGDLEVLYHGQDGGVWHVRHRAADGVWEQPEFLWDGAPVSLASAARADGRLTGVVATRDGEIWMTEQSAPDGAWGEFTRLPGTTNGAVTMVADSADGLRLFYRGPDGHPRTRSHAGRDGQDEETVLGNDARGAAPAPVVAGDGRLVTVVAGEDGTVFVNRQTEPSGPGWDDYESIGVPMTGPLDVIRDGRGRIHLAFADGADGHLSVASQQPLRRDRALTEVYPTPDFPGGQSRVLGTGAQADAARSGWAGSRRTDVLDVRFTGLPGTAQDRHGQVVVFVHDTVTDTLRWTRRTQEGGWTPFDGLAGAPEPIAGSPVASRARDGRIGVFFRAPGGELRYATERRDGGSGWCSSRSTGLRILGDPVVGHDANGLMTVHAIGEDTTVWQLRTDAPGPEGFTAEPSGDSAAALAVARLHVGQGQAGGGGRVPFLLRTDPDGQVTEHLGTGPGRGPGVRVAGGVTAPPALAAGVHSGAGHLLSHTDGRLTAWTRGSDGTWSAASQLGTACVDRPAPVLLPHGRLAAFCRAPGGQVRAVFENWNTDGGSWYGAGVEVHEVADGAVTAVCAQPDDFGRIVLAYGTAGEGGATGLALTVLGDPEPDPPA
ncbi:hypothetical protein [Streptomyces sp. NPDC006638]|uniref:hypothetical protein n=1 Tax=Streptomyces sp. NPDC006638 TaxID=3157183 RepID=UPI0033BA7D41